MLSPREIQHRTFGLPRDANSFPFLSPRFWHGMRLGDWLKLVVENHGRVHPWCWLMALSVSGTACVNSMLSCIQQLTLGPHICRTSITQAPVFIIGYWRSGTTYLHELFSLDSDLTAPTTLQCFAPSHFLISEPLLDFWLKYLLPTTRPMDDLPTGLGRPQEDEFALCSLGVESPYRLIAFPNHPDRWLPWLTMENVDAAQRQRWQAAMQYFCQAITYQNGKRLVLKSPTHTGRLKLLSQMFPQARFVHIVRHPYEMLPSAIRLWKILYATQAFQVPQHDGLEEYVFKSFEEMYAGFQRQRHCVDSSHLVELKYEQLISEPVNVMQRLYEQLQLENFGRVRSQFVKFAEETRSFRVHRHEPSPSLREKIRQHCKAYMQDHGYREGLPSPTLQVPDS